MDADEEIEENGSRSIFRCKNGPQVQALIFFRDISIKCAPRAVHSKSRKSFFLIIFKIRKEILKHDQSTAVGPKLLFMRFFFFF